MERKISCGGREKEIYLHASGTIYFSCEMETGIFDDEAKATEIPRMSPTAASDGFYSSDIHLLSPLIGFAYKSDDDRFAPHNLSVSDVCVLISPSSIT